MNVLDAMRIYLRVAEQESFTRCAESLSLPKTSVSNAIQQLENLLGTRLLHRTTRKVQMTQDGLSFYQRCQDLLSDMDELQNMFQLQPQALDGRLRVDMPSGIAQHMVLPALPAFLEAHPKLDIELSSTDRRVDLVREGFDCVLRIGQLHDSNLIARPLGFLTMHNCASPSYLARHGTPRTLQDLANHRLIHYSSPLGSPSPGFEYQRPDADPSPRTLPMAGALSVNSSDAYQAACLAGLGLIQIPCSGSQSLIASGQLIEVLHDYRPAPMPVSLLYAHRRHQPRRVQVFMDWIAEQIRPHLQRNDEIPARD